MSRILSMSAEVGEIEEGGDFAARLTIVGLPSEFVADKVAEWVYSMIEQNMAKMLSDCAPDGHVLAECSKVGEPETEH